MARVLLALFAILVVALSSGLTHTRMPTPTAPASAALQAIGARQAIAAQIDYANPREPARLLAPVQGGEELPQPAVLAYLGLILVGSLVGIALVRREIGREI